MRTISANYILPITGEPIKNGYLKIDDKGEIIEIGTLTQEKEDIEFYNGIICPGFVNAHCHIELSYLKGYFNQGGGMSDFINQINSLRLAVEKDKRIESISNQMQYLYKQGVNAMADISNCNESFEAKRNSKIYTRTYLELFGSEPKDAENVLTNGLELEKEILEFGLDGAITPHSCYTMSPKLLEETAFQGLKSGFISYHNQESPQEEELILSGTGELAENYKGRNLSTPPVTGKSALIYFIDRLLAKNTSPIKENVLLVHNVVTNQESIDYAKEHLENSSWVICPLSNIFIHRQLPPLGLMRKNNLNICMGTDSLSSNTILSIIEEMKCIQDNFSDIPLTEIFEWATINGAKALNKTNELGSLEVGKKPGIVLVENVDCKNFKLTKESFSRRLV